MLLHLVEMVSHWDGKILTTANELRAGVVGYAHGNWVVATPNETDAMRIEYGTQALARAVVGSGRIGKFNTRSRK